MYKLIIKQTYRGYIDSRDRINYYVERSYDTIDEIMAAMTKESKPLRNLDILYEENVSSQHRVIRREIYQARNGHGRIAQRYEIVESRIQPQEAVSLI